MAKKHWIYLKRGLSEDPKHRAQMSECIWLFMHIIDRADWETGIAYDWKDSEEAADMGMNVDTLRAQRQKLEKMDYIRCKQKQHSQDVKIMEWINPRDYSAGVVNPRIESPVETLPSEGGAGTLPSTDSGLVQGGSQGGSQVSGQNPTPTLDSESESSSLGKGGLSETEIQEANSFMDAIIELDKAPKMTNYLNRDKMPEPYLPYCDFYVGLIGKDPDGEYIQVPTKRVLMEWMHVFEEWKQERLTRADIAEAWKQANSDRGFSVSGPSALTKTAVSIRTKRLSKNNSAPALNESEIERTKREIEEKDKFKGSPRPASVQPPSFVLDKMKDLANKKGTPHATTRISSR